MSTGIQKVTFSAQEAADYLGVAYITILRMVKRGEIQSIRAGRKVLLRKETLDEWMNQQEQESIMTEDEKDKVSFFKKAIV